MYSEAQKRANYKWRAKNAEKHKEIQKKQRQNIMKKIKMNLMKGQKHIIMHIKRKY